MTKLSPQHFIGEPIEVIFDQPPALEKKPPCPDSFVWHGQTYRIAAELEAWHDYDRKGRMATNMRPAHAEAAAGRGSWGVGRYFFRVRTDDGRALDLYFDRAPGKAGDRMGHWFLFRELRQEAPPSRPASCPGEEEGSPLERRSRSGPHSVLGTWRRWRDASLSICNR